MAALPSAPTPGTISTPFIPGYGYGVAAAVGPAIQYANSLDLQKRQMAVNEAAEERANTYFQTIEGEMADRQKQKLADTNAAIGAYTALGGTSAPPPDTPRPASAYAVPGSTVPANYPLPPGSQDAAGAAAQRQVPSPAYGAPGAAVASNEAPASATKITDEDIKKMGTYENVASMTGKVVPVPMGGVKGGATGGSELRTPGFTAAGGGAKGGYGAPSAPETGAGAGMTPQQALATAEGKTAITPTEGNGMLQKSQEMRTNATAIQGRLDDALKMIDKQYSGDPTYAAYAKAGLIAKVSPQVAQMNAQANSLKNDGELANHMQIGAQLGSRIWSQISNGGAIDQKFVEANRGMMNTLGIQESDLHIFDGMHLANGKHPGDSSLNAGWVVNRGGFIIPPKALWEASNFGLPYAQRAQAWDEMTKMYHIQMDEKQKLITAQNTSPTMLPQIAEENIKRVLGDYSTAQRIKDHTFNVLTTGGSLMLPGPDGKLMNTAISAPPKPTSGTLNLDDVMAGYKKRFFSRDPTLPATIAAAISAHLDATAAADKAMAVKNVWDHFSTKSVNVGSAKDPNEVRFEGDLAADEKIRVYNKEHPQILRREAEQ